jgi:hypothetical protein
VLYDPNTYIAENERNCYILYDADGNEALIFRPKRLVTRVGMRLFKAVLDLFPVSDDVE